MAFVRSRAFWFFNEIGTQTPVISLGFTESDANDFNAGRFRQNQAEAFPVIAYDPYDGSKLLAFCGMWNSGVPTATEGIEVGVRFDTAQGTGLTPNGTEAVLPHNASIDMIAQWESTEAVVTIDNDLSVFTFQGFSTNPFPLGKFLRYNAADEPLRALLPVKVIGRANNNLAPPTDSVQTHLDAIHQSEKGTFIDSGVAVDDWIIRRNGSGGFVVEAQQITAVAADQITHNAFLTVTNERRAFMVAHSLYAGQVTALGAPAVVDSTKNFNDAGVAATAWRDAVNAGGMEMWNLSTGAVHPISFTGVNNAFNASDPVMNPNNSGISVGDSYILVPRPEIRINFDSPLDNVSLAAPVSTTVAGQFRTYENSGVALDGTITFTSGIALEIDTGARIVDITSATFDNANDNEMVINTGRQYGQINSGDVLHYSLITADNRRLAGEITVT